MAEEKLLNKVPVVEIHQPKKNRDINPFFRPYVLSSVKIKIVKNPWRFKILMTFHFSVKQLLPEKAIEKHSLRYVLFSECGIALKGDSLQINSSSLVEFHSQIRTSSPENFHHKSEEEVEELHEVYYGRE